MAQKQSRHRSHPDFRHRSQISTPAVEDVEQRLFDVLSPSLLAPRQLERHDPRQPQRVIRMRQRLLTLPVLVAIIVSLVWRRIPAVAEVQRVLAREGLLWEPPLSVSPQAITKRLDVVPAVVMGEPCAEVGTRLQAQALLPRPSRTGHRCGSAFRCWPLWMARHWKRCAKRPRPCKSSRAWYWRAKCWSWWRRSAIGPCGSTIPKTPWPTTSAVRGRFWRPCHRAGMLVFSPPTCGATKSSSFLPEEGERRQPTGS